MNQKDLKRYKKILEDSKVSLLQSAKKTLMEESNFDTDDLPDEIDLASSEYAQSMVFRLRDREKFLLKKIERALSRLSQSNGALRTYDAVGNLLVIAGSRTNTYDALNRLASTSVGGLSYTYDALSRRASMTDAYAGTTRYTYDAYANGRCSQKKRTASQSLDWPSSTGTRRRHSGRSDSPRRFCTLGSRRQLIPATAAV